MTINNLPYFGCSAVITGGGGLLGREHGMALTEIGYTVYLFDVDIEKLKEAKEYIVNEVKGAEVQIVNCDITSEESIKLAIKNLKLDTKELKCLINNAAINPEPGLITSNNTIENFDINHWNLELSVGLTGAVLMSKHVGPLIADSGGGFILNISSDLSIISPDQRIYRIHGSENFVKPVSYSIIKSGLVGLTRYLATYWAEQNIRVNSLSPGGVENGQPIEFVRNLEKLIPMSRMARKDEYRGAVKFLCSSQSSYMTGQNLVMDGGRSVW